MLCNAQYEKYTKNITNLLLDEVKADVSNLSDKKSKDIQNVDSKKYSLFMVEITMQNPRLQDSLKD